MDTSIVHVLLVILGFSVKQKSMNVLMLSVKMEVTVLT